MDTLESDNEESNRMLPQTFNRKIQQNAITPALVARQSNLIHKKVRPPTLSLTIRFQTITYKSNYSQFINI